MTKRLGKQSVYFQSPPIWVCGSSIVGKKESEGPLGSYFDQILDDDLLGQDSWELAEREMFCQSVELALQKANLQKENVDMLFGGDLLNQIITASYAARKLAIPYAGIYGACSNMSLSLAMGSCHIDGGFAQHVVCATSSHFSSAERQYRFPLEFGNQRNLYAQWTVTGAGASVLSAAPPMTQEGIAITHATFGKVIDFGIKDANNMGAAMAPAAMDTMKTHFEDMASRPSDYDLIVTGDLGNVGRDIVRELMLQQHQIDLGDRYIDCGSTIFTAEQDTHAGGSGCGCAATVLNGFLRKILEKNEKKKILFIATGALLSITSSQQGESIPSIAHAVVIERRG